MISNIIPGLNLASKRWSFLAFSCNHVANGGTAQIIQQNILHSRPNIYSFDNYSFYNKQSLNDPLFTNMNFNIYYLRDTSHSVLANLFIINSYLSIGSLKYLNHQA